ncbi:MAG: XisI protein [Alkalinema sp. RU_4_3]|nr:XisI protein [Alkalinema sp. RU_4_3]
MDAQTRVGLVDSMVFTTSENKLDSYRQIVLKILKESSKAPVNGKVQTVFIADLEGDHYQILDLGWDENGRRIFQPVVHVDLIQGKVWIQENMTDKDFAKNFVENGIASSDIVLGFHSMLTRQYGEYAVE